MKNLKKVIENSEFSLYNFLIIWYNMNITYPLGGGIIFLIKGGSCLMNNKKRLISLFVVCAMLIMATLSGCGGNGAGGSASGDYVMDEVLNPLGSDVICKEPVELEIMLAQRGQVIDYDTNTYTLEIERKGNIDIKFNLLPFADATTKINLTLSTGTDLPDVVNTLLDISSIATYGEAGTFVPLNKYYENSSEYLVPQMEKLKEENSLDIFDYITMSDGNIYGMFQYNESLQNEIPDVLWINKAWLDKAGMEVPTTLDEFVAALRAFKAQDMNGNGKKDELPIIDSSTGHMMEVIENAFVRTGFENVSIAEDGSLTMAYMTEGYREFLKFMKTLYDEGLLDKTTFSQDHSTLKTLLNAETPRVGVFTWTSTSVLTAGTPRRENHEYVPMFLENTNKPGYNTFRYMQTMPDQFWFITSACEHPEVAFRIGDYMCSEEMTVWTRWGEKGVDWLVPSESTVGMFDFMGYPAYLEPVLQWGSTQNSHWMADTPGFRRTNISLGMASNDTSQEAKSFAIKELYERYGENFAKDVIDQRVYGLIYSTEELDDKAELVNGLDSYVANMRYEFITGIKNLDSDWDAYIKELKGLNVDKLNEINNTAYERMTSK